MLLQQSLEHRAQVERGCEIPPLIQGAPSPKRLAAMADVSDSRMRPIARQVARRLTRGAGLATGALRYTRGPLQFRPLHDALPGPGSRRRLFLCLPGVSRPAAAVQLARRADRSGAR